MSPLFSRLVPPVALMVSLFCSEGMARAACGDTVLVAHSMGSYFSGCQDAAQVPAFAFALANPAAIQTNDRDIVCESESSTPPCQTLGGTPGDGRVDVLFNWSSSGILGCPLGSGYTNGSGRIVTIVAPPGGSSLVTSIAYSADFLYGYVVEAAHPTDGQVVFPLDCAAAGTEILRLDGVASEAGTLTIDTTVLAPHVFSDCDPGTIGALYGTCPEGPGAIPAVGPGRVYTRLGLCQEFGGTLPLRTGEWTLAGTPDPAGHVRVIAPAPPAGYCLSVGATFTLGGVETPAVAAYHPIPSDQPCHDADGDSNFDCLTDCDDSNAGRYPGNPEVCDSVDNDCNGSIDDGIVCQGACFPPRKLGPDLLVADVLPDSYAASVVWTGTGYGVALFSTSPGGVREIYFARLDPAGAPVGPIVQVSDSPFISTAPSLVWTGSEFGIAWYDNRDGEFEIYFARLDESGAPVGGNVRVTTTQAGAISPSLTWNGEGYGLAWSDNRDDPYEREIYFTRLTPTGDKVGGDIRITTAASVRPGWTRLAWNGNGYGLAWTDARPVSFGGSRIYFALLSRTGARLADEQRVSDGNGDVYGTSLVWNGSGYGLAWVDARNVGTLESKWLDIYFARLDTSGTPVGPNARVTSADLTVSVWPSLTWIGAEYGLAWQDFRDGNYEIYFAGLTADGERIGEEYRVTDAPNTSGQPWLAWTGEEFGVVWLDARLDLYSRAYFTRIGCDTLDRDADASLRPTDCDDSRRDVHPGAPETCDDRDNDCDGFIDDGPDGADSDSDGIAGACDNCPLFGNLGQEDLNGDGQGDACDLDDGVIRVDATDPLTIAWQQEAGFSSFNLYRGDLSVLRQTGEYTQDPAVVPLAMRVCGIDGTSLPDGPDPAPGEGVFYLVTGNSPFGESSLGVDHDGRQRPNSHPCP